MIEPSETDHRTLAGPPGADPHTRWKVLLAAALGAVAGFVAAVALSRPTVALAARPPRAPGDAAGWMALARRGAESGATGPLAQALASDPALFHTIVAEYGRTEARPLRATIREAIIAAAGAGATTAGLELTRDRDALGRAAGFELLARLPPTDEAYQRAMRGADEETDPTALAAALMALRPPGLPSNADAARMLPRLSALAQHPDPLVRGHAIQQLSDWDKTGERAAPIVLAAFADRTRLVREAAVGAVMIGGLRSPGLEEALLRTAGDPAEDAAIRGSALQALERYVLTDAEQARYRAARDDLQRIFKTHGTANHTQER